MGDYETELKVAKFEVFVTEITQKMEAVKGSWFFKLLGVFYDIENVNDYAKIIMKKAYFGYVDGDFEAFYEGDYRNGAQLSYSNTNKRIEATKCIASYCKKNGNCKRVGYHLIFWALMVLAVDKTDASKHLSEICAVAKMIGITDEEMMDIVHIIKCLYLIKYRPYRDYNKSNYWLRKAAEEGDLDCMRALSNRYNNGCFGLPENHLDSYRWGNKYASGDGKVYKAYGEMSVSP